MFLKQKCIILHKQISDMVADKQEEVAALEMKLQTLDKDLEWKKEVLSPIFLQSCWYTVHYFPSLSYANYAFR